MSIEDVRTLVAERQRYDDWLASLEAKRADTPVRVFERVYGDYSGRRTAVVERLRAHLRPLAALGADLDARSQALESELATHEDERAEAMLRTAVGEFDADRWELVRLEVESSIAKLEAQRDELRAEIEDVRSLLESARSGQAPEIGDDLVADVEVTEDAAIAEVPTADTEEQADGASENAAVESIAEEVVSFDAASPMPASDAPAVIDVPSPTPAFLAAVATPTPIATPVVSEVEPIDVGEPAWLLPQPTPLSSREPTPVSIESIAASDDLDGTDFDDALALFSPSPRQPIDEPTPADSRTVNLLDPYSADDDLAERVVPAGSKVPSSDAATAPAGARATDDSARDPFDDLAFLRSVIDPATQGGASRNTASGEQQKTLRCTECGTMNFPTEWYCERCGGELAAF